MSNLIDKGLKVASYAVGGLNILKGEGSKGLMLINSQRQIIPQRRLKRCQIKYKMRARSSLKHAREKKKSSLFTVAFVSRVHILLRCERFMCAYNICKS